MSTGFANQTTIFADERVLSEDWVPDDLPEREDELAKLHSALSPAARGVAGRNTFLYGKAGIGKTAAAKVKLNELQTHADEESDILDLTTLHFSCDGLTTSYQVACEIVEELTGTRPNGHATATVFNKMFDEFNRIGGTIILVLDEIDNIGTDDQILYSIPRARAKDYVGDDVWPSVIGISNDLQWRDNLSPKVKDSLYDESVHFAPYDATQLQDILQRRAEQAFVDGALEDDIIPLCAAMAAQDKGSARQAIRYLYKAGQLASDNRNETVTEAHVRAGKDEIERERVEQGMVDLTTQGHLTLAATTALELAGETPCRTKTVYSKYKSFAHEIDADVLAMRRMRDHLLDLDMQGILVANERTGGSPGGRYYTFELAVEPDTARDVLSDITRLNLNQLPT